MTPDEYCEQKAAPSGSRLHYSLLFLPPPPRTAIIALHAFRREVDDVVDEVSDPAVARLKLAWWRQQVAAAYDGRAEHPVARALQSVVTQYELPQSELQTVIDGMAMDLDVNRYVNFASLERYCDKAAGVVALMSARIFGYSEAATLDYARDLGVAFQLTDIVRGVGEDARRGRIYLPQDELARFGVVASSILQRQASDSFRALMEYQVKRVRGWYERALAKLPPVDRHAQRAGLIMAAIERATLDEIARDGYRVLDRRLSLTPLRKLWIACRTALST